MLSNVNSLTGYRLDSKDGQIGSVKEFYFDDRFWTIRYLIADTGNWLQGRMVLISPHALFGISTDDHTISIELTRQQIEESPSLDHDVPVSQQFEEDYFGYYGWPIYWGGPYVWGETPHIQRSPDELFAEKNREKSWDLNLRSTHDIVGHDVEAADGRIGHVEDMILDDQNWTIRYFIVDTGNLMPGKKVLISPRWIESISSSKSNVRVTLSKDAVLHSPEYIPGSLVTREYETQLHHYYKEEGYWVTEPAAKRMAHLG